MILCFYCYYDRRGSRTERAKPERVPLLRAGSLGTPRSALSIQKPPVVEFVPPTEVTHSAPAELELTESPDVSISSNASDERQGLPIPAPVAASVDDLHHWLTYDERVHLTARAFRERGLREQVRPGPP